MELQQQSSQSDHTPHIRVARDERGSACWEVVSGDQRIQCTSGQQAIAVCEEVRRAKDLPTPES